jgi:hypothetical protein
MSQEKSALRVTELDFLSIKENLKAYLRSQSEFQDYDFEGSGMSILLEILAYNTHYMAYYANMTANEMFLDSAQLRNSIISHAKLMNYVPGSPQGALSKINVTVTPSNAEDQDATTLTLNKYTRLLGTDKDGVNYPFVTLYSNTSVKADGAFTFSNVFIKQGEVNSIQYLMEASNDSRRFSIPSSNVDTTTVVINVQESSTNTDISTYSLADDITELTANSKVYFLEENENAEYTFYFGDDVIGKKPRNGNIIICTFLDNVGSISNNVNNFTFVQPIGGYSDNVITESTVSSYGGTEKETVEQVRFRAPYFYSTQNRAVTKNDYETLILKDYNTIDAVSVWGGEDNDPVVYGKVFISLKTKQNYELTNFEKERIKDGLIRSRNVLTITPEIVDPDYIYIQIKGTVSYDPKLTSLTSDELVQYVKSAIYDYADSDLNTFDSTFRKSKLQRYVDNCEKSITSCDLRVYVQKRVEIDTDNTRTYTIQYKMPLRHMHHKEVFTTYPSIEVRDSSSIPRDVYIEEQSEGETGVYGIHVTDGGQNYTSAPTVTIIGNGRGATARATILGGRVTSIVVEEPGTDYSFAYVSITGGEGSGAAAEVQLRNTIGDLRMYYYKDNGEKAIINNECGTIDYSTGEVVLNSLRAFSVEENDFYDDDILAISVQADDDTIRPLRNRILTIDENDPRGVDIQMIAE